MATTPPPTSMITIDGPTLSALIPPSILIPHLLTSLPSLSPAIHTPPRLSYPLSPSSSSLLLLMPSWSLSPSLPYIGVKILTSLPHLSPSPSLHSSFSLLSSLSGSPLASLDGTLLTLLRTSSLSAAAASLLSLPSPSTLLLVGSGALAPHLISAHRSSRPSLRRFILWNRSPHKSISLASHLQQLDQHATYEHTVDIDSAVSVADIVVCATSSERPIVRGDLLKDGAHLSLVGSFRREMRECDDEAMRRGRVFVDVAAAAEEAGEIVGAIERGAIGREDVVGTLAELAGGKVVGRRSDHEITVFKSVGSAEFDLLAAQLAYESCLKGSGTQKS